MPSDDREALQDVDDVVYSSPLDTELLRALVKEQLPFLLLAIDLQEFPAKLAQAHVLPIVFDVEVLRALRAVVGGILPALRALYLLLVQRIIVSSFLIHNDVMCVPSVASDLYFCASERYLLLVRTVAVAEIGLGAPVVGVSALVDARARLAGVLLVGSPLAG